VESSLPRQPWLSSTTAPWVFVLIGIAAMYVPVYWAAANWLWQSDDNGHGPIILLIALWLFWQAKGRVLQAPNQPQPALGWSLLMFGLLFYIFGRIINAIVFQFLSQVMVVAALMLLLKGPGALRAASFAVFYLMFLVPLPGVLVDAATGPLKRWISYIVVELLHGMGYPIARAGVTITIAQYQLLVADACSGLNSMISLLALGTLFMYLMARRGVAHNVVMAATIVPIAFLANVVRVVILVLVTYHLGDEAGQGFLHGAAGIVLMLVALALFFAVDTLLVSLRKKSGLAFGAQWWRGVS
jgi:exosortase B